MVTARVASVNKNLRFVAEYKMQKQDSVLGFLAEYGLFIMGFGLLIVGLALVLS
jgi:hypothetical protein